MRISNHALVPVYTIAGSSTARPIPDWLARKRKRSLKNDPEHTNRVELLQDFEFEEASSCVRISEDGQWVMSTGTYKPQIHTHYLPHLSLSFARHTTSLNQTFLLLSSDYSKSLHLQVDRSLEFHTPQGCHYSTRIPRYGRDLKYDKRSAEALIPAVGVNSDGNGEVFRLNLEVGRYMRGYEVDVGGVNNDSGDVGTLQGGVKSGSVNVAAIAEESHGLLAFGTSLGTVEFWDSRSRGRVGLIAGRDAVTALDFQRSGLNFAIGTSEGVTRLFDLRSPVPILHKDQGYGYPVQTIQFLKNQAQENKVLTADKRIIKIWDQQSGHAWTSVEPAVDINCVAWFADTGMILTANEGKQQHAFFIPQLGPAPKWCTFLDNIVEDMEDNADSANGLQSSGAVYDNYKFLTAPQLEQLNLAHLIGSSSLLRPYMHGFFVSQKLYEEAKLIADPYIWEEQRAKRIKEAVDKVRESRIRGGKKLEGVKVNKKLAQKIMERGTKAQHDTQSNLLSDSRFNSLFQDEDFVVDEKSTEFKSLNPSTRVATDVDKRKTAAEVEDEGNMPGLGPTSSDEESSEAASTNPDSDETNLVLSKNRISSESYRRSGHRPKMHVSSSKAHSKDRSFSSRTALAKRNKVEKRNVTGDKQISFQPQSNKRKQPNLTKSKGAAGEKIRRSASGNVFRNL